MLCIQCEDCVQTCCCRCYSISDHAPHDGHNVFSRLQQILGMRWVLLQQYVCVLHEVSQCHVTPETIFKKKVHFRLFRPQ